MEFDSPEEKEFPGLYAAEHADGRSKQESDYSECDLDKSSKKDAKRKDKKDKGKDRGYAALEGESSPEEEMDAKSPTKSTKKSKTFKFTSTKSKEKRDKSRDKEKEKKEKSKDKEKDKQKKDKKSQQHTCDDDLSTDEVQILATNYPVFGVSISLATDRSRCHDGIDLPLVVRDCIDYIQETSLRCEQLYKLDSLKSHLVHWKCLYNNRERIPERDIFDMPTACSLLKLFLKELPEPILTTDLIVNFENIASHSTVSNRLKEIQDLIEQLPKCNQTLLAWLFLHFDNVIQNERYNKLNPPSLAMILSPALQMSHRLMITLLYHIKDIFPNVKLCKYVPPLTASSPKLPDDPEALHTELRKQESLLTQIHSEMNAGYVTKKREEQLWAVQRIITQLKRKLRSFEKKQEKSLEESESTTSTRVVTTTTVTATVADEQVLGSATENEDAFTVAKLTPEDFEQQTNLPNDPMLTISEIFRNLDLHVDAETGLVVLPKTHPQYEPLLRVQLEFQNLLMWKKELQSRITLERAEVLRLKQAHQYQLTRLQQQQQQQAGAKNIGAPAQLEDEDETLSDLDYEKLIENYTCENKLLENKLHILGKELFQERRDCIALQVELGFQQY